MNTGPKGPDLVEGVEIPQHPLGIASAIRFSSRNARSRAGLRPGAGVTGIAPGLM